MKKFLLIATVGIFAVSCGTKESSMSKSSSDSTAVDNSTTASPATTDTTTTRTANPDSITLKADSATTVK
ncbi:CCR4-NOT transcriptional regulation complex NOT5 subunit [Chryseobacterium ginsenosidimutans]|uniref:cytochrome C551 n=1 Tax=Chryseobacterium ginsenosidimutans TaxID=687846 RepID=UPI00277FF484|nr:cytochrome C551 [Chryseobacterium ginsenosidimutans]MDQ0593306.1 CCR4-NOT transcriptional regulation complex NOT5 subunit [Chryseobacterium ginsenosidimutans]